eukprot:TRINITY_DN18740_c0_g1_i1.p1 TRINITY_DN18740_c0_g1~~TRINITY_DN18740_c0_g1_i1.p1  ORF type:complete len:314 (-),score=49.45 TRINITY_DN18740_c0_g1_i1:222-1163(-)
MASLRWPATLAVALLNLPVVTGLLILDNRSTSSTIPKIVWTTGRYKGSNEMKQLSNFAHSDTLEEHYGTIEDLVHAKTGGEQMKVERALLRWAPPGSEIRYVDDAGMKSSVEEMAPAFESKGVRGVAKAFHALRAGSFKADLWRLMVLWYHGGVYLDVNIVLEKKLTDFIDFEKDTLVLVKDAGVPGHCLKKGVAFWNAVMASSRHNRYLLAGIASVVQNIEKRSYDWCYLTDVTGPSALGNIIGGFPGYQKNIRMEYEWHNPAVRRIGDNGSDWWVRRLCTKNESLHDGLTSRHYTHLWENRAIYCDEKHPC